MYRYGAFPYVSDHASDLHYLYVELEDGRDQLLLVTYGMGSRWLCVARNPPHAREKRQVRGLSRMSESQDDQCSDLRCLLDSMGCAHVFSLPDFMGIVCSYVWIDRQ